MNIRDEIAKLFNGLALLPSPPLAWQGFKTYAQMDTFKTRLMLVFSEQDVDRIVSAASVRAISGTQSFVDSLQYAYELAMSGKTVEEIETALRDK